MTREAITMQITYGKHEIPIEVVYEERNQLAITVRPDMSVEARAPLGSEPKRVQKKLDEKARWVWRQLDHFEKYQPLQPPREYVAGETHLYLGRQYRLLIEQGLTSSVRLIGKFFHVETLDPEDREQIKALLSGWYQAHAKVLIKRRVEKYLPDVERYGAERPEVRIQWMKKRWGSCTPNHLVHPNHSPAFYRLLNVLMPDWQKRRARLERVTV